MTGAVLDRPGSAADGRELACGSTPGRGVTLEELLTTALCEARTNGSADCPVCRARMTSTRASARAGAAPAAECGGCGSRLS